MDGTVAQSVSVSRFVKTGLSLGFVEYCENGIDAVLAQWPLPRTRFRPDNCRFATVAQRKAMQEPVVARVTGGAEPLVRVLFL